MENKEINLEVITQQFRNKGEALKGFKNLNQLISNDEVEKLKILLRNHKKKPIETQTEILKRDSIDFLIDYYSILEIASIADYIPKSIPIKIKNEANYILNNKFIKKYFSKYYPLLLPQVFICEINLKERKTHNSFQISAYSSFERFLILRQFIKQDKDIDQFLWFLDDGWTDNYSIRDFWNILNNQERIRYKLGRSNNHPLNKALWGFIKYIEFLSEYATLIRDTKDNPLLQSAIWHHQSYWFKNMKSELGDIIKIGIKNIADSIKNSNSEELIFNSTSFLSSPEEFESLGEAFQSNPIIKDIEYLLNERHGQPLIEYYNNMNKIN